MMIDVVIDYMYTLLLYLTFIMEISPLFLEQRTLNRIVYMYCMYVPPSCFAVVILVTQISLDEDLERAWWCYVPNRNIAS